jgi:hypothetical protein
MKHVVALLRVLDVPTCSVDWETGYFEVLSWFSYTKNRDGVQNKP